MELSASSSGSDVGDALAWEDASMVSERSDQQRRNSSKQWTSIMQFGSFHDAKDYLNISTSFSHLECPHELRIVAEQSYANLEDSGLEHAAEQDDDSSGIHPQNSDNDSSRKKSGGWEISNLADLITWGQAHLCATKESFFDREETFVYEEFIELDNAYRHKLIVLDIIEGTFTSDSVESTYAGLVVTSRQNMWNIAWARDRQGDSLTIATDGTYKLHFGGWTLIDLGAVYTRYTSGSFRHRFLPWTYIFVRVECEEVYFKLFDVTATKFEEFFDTNLIPATASIDHTRVVLRSHEAAYVACRSHHQFHVIAAICLSEWMVDLGEIELSTWFRDVYLSPPWDQWFSTASNCPGVMPHQQHIESHHKSIKIVYAHELRATTSVVLEHTLPRVLVSDGLEINTSPDLWDESPVSTTILEKALLVEQVSHLHQVAASTVLFNSTTHMRKKITSTRSKATPTTVTMSFWLA
ncbi:hypothetical protein H257_15461 [Aphanomyces astaci]|uniref:Uncharacterized protein n=1 Tax=Aphanomyces astaci TaxID=112090 RepID=W4FMG0_APHAT|nr:hypothetical protein H257_15461 [Aphanomyces astaci]ETV68655.1 hypothetical protein H257_15461 [Aphanomyces astaci]|eukprot:XP_009841880.1 hypothetical protein H257_15461 [Aphanomyces astaci]